MNLIDKKALRKMGIAAMIAMVISVAMLIIFPHWMFWVALVISTAVMMFVNSTL